MKRKHKIPKYIVGLLLVGLLLIYIVYPIGEGFFATFRYPSNVGKTPTGFNDITLTTSDKVRLAAWYAPAKNGKAIILMHGATNSREGVRAQALMLQKDGYGVLVFDLRGHGKSGGNGVNGFGWDSQLDIEAAVTFLRNQTPVVLIGALGLSIGGEALLSASSMFPEIKAIVSDGATFRSLGDYLAIPAKQPLLLSFTNRLMYASATFFSQKNPPTRIADSIQKSISTHYLFIAANIENEVLYNQMYHEMVFDQSEIWIVEGVEHIKAFDKYPDEYEKRIHAFFEKFLIVG
jgi:pimeloyl-ACP methyl ester carboxylesterase